MYKLVVLLVVLGVVCPAPGLSNGGIISGNAAAKAVDGAAAPVVGRFLPSLAYSKLITPRPPIVVLLVVLGVVCPAPGLSNGGIISGNAAAKAVDGAAAPVVGRFLPSLAYSKLITPRPPIVINSTIDSQVQIINSTYNHGARH
ncbi:hypothetical protein JTB14_014667 [Gonioctena quinquepunctata]|nr:hypothetical protein JTB14_014667 [Gonioctena quinquepunctata]